ncbi:CRISPR-associated protein Cas4 [Phycisphaera mikurensis]|uniref:CRISPR-associated exonuclease Cas4 n=1 Tax=Phycisphaera mikurensis (strain NBRC 102666 / KCTC 22515 / FYK2301M01) TaxID=1142394 RepID=I0IC61_PHYMF|nr:CRISPR-associated protein Cas4 [Phycisphaera mikurensis]MBB6441932.1 CRISPR-associated exonuclease Cas4 [Phycisphaera mikurensis]BAM02849.1 CRISPR-associated protein [Phycisphaera mikurensis NBRC 102666]
MASTSFAEADLRPISALQHLFFCPRQCALIHNEQEWEENRLTAEGRVLHEKAHDDTAKEHRPGRDGGPGRRTTRGLPLRSFEHGLIGQADVVEFDDPAEGSGATAAPGAVRPVEYKRGKPKAHQADRVQLCAQALCLEEMLGLEIASGHLFYGKVRRREPVVFDLRLRTLTAATAARLHELLGSGRTPAAVYESAKCDRCSLIRVCMPKQGGRDGSAAARFDRELARSLKAGSA